MARKRIRSRKSNNRRYGDCPPHPTCNTGKSHEDCRPRPTGVRRYSSVGKVVSGFDHYGYPVVRNMRLPKPFGVVQGRQYGAAESMIRPMRLVAVGPNGEAPPPKPGIATVGVFKLKPSPSVPAAPASLPSQYKFCVQQSADGSYFYRFRNAKTSLHGATAEVVSCDPGDGGMMICKVKMPNSERLYDAPLCEGAPGTDKEPISPDCCVKVLGDESGQIVCPGSAYDLLIVNIVTFAHVGGIAIASVSHPDLPGGGTRLPICEPIDETPEERPCCIEERTGLIVCPEGVDFPLAGKKIPLGFLTFGIDEGGMKIAKLNCGDILEIDPSERAGNETLDAMWTICEQLGGYVFQVCEQGPPSVTVPEQTPELPPPPKVPDLCCYDPSTGTLVCEGTKFHGLPVEVVTEAVVGGKSIVSVKSERLPGGGARLPICPPPVDVPKLPPGECCVIESSAGLVLMCTPEDHPWHNKDVSKFGQCIDTPNGRMCVLKWKDDYGEHLLEVPACPPPPPPPPPPNGEVPPPPPPVRPDPVPKLPPPTRPPADGCDDPEATHCRAIWDEMVSKPAKLLKCDKKWIELVNQLNNRRSGPGRRASSMKNHQAKARRYGMGIAPEHRKYARFPGLRGGRRTI